MTSQKELTDELVGAAISYGSLLLRLQKASVPNGRSTLLTLENELLSLAQQLAAATTPVAKTSKKKKG